MIFKPGNHACKVTTLRNREVLAVAAVEVKGHVTRQVFETGRTRVVNPTVSGFRNSAIGSARAHPRQPRPTCACDAPVVDR